MTAVNEKEEKIFLDVSYILDKESMAYVFVITESQYLEFS